MQSYSLATIFHLVEAAEVGLIQARTERSTDLDVTSSRRIATLYGRTLT